MKKKFRPWLLLYLLGLIVTFAMGVRRGGSVGLENTAKLENIIRELRLSPNSAPTPPLPLFKTTGVMPCGIRFLLPDLVSTESAEISIRCDDDKLPDVKTLQKEGYIKISVPQSNPLTHVWIKSPPELQEVIEMSIQFEKK